MDKIFDVRDKNGRLIYLSFWRWKDNILAEHPYLSNSLEDIKETLIKPTAILLSKYDLNVRYYYRWMKERKEYLMVAVKYLNSVGFVITCCYRKNMKK